MIVSFPKYFLCFTAAGVHSGVITEDLDEIDRGRIKVDTLQGDARHKSAAIEGLLNNEDTTNPLGEILTVFELRQPRSFPVQCHLCLMAVLQRQNISRESKFFDRFFLIRVANQRTSLSVMKICRTHRSFSLMENRQMSDNNFCFRTGRSCFSD